MGILLAWRAMLSALCTLLLLAPGGGCRPAGDEVATRLASLSSPLAEERARAERWLSVHATRDHFPLLAEAAESGDAEVRRRIGRIVGSEDAKLGLAVLFLMERDPALDALAEDAIGEMLARWSTGFDGAPLVGEELVVALRELLEDDRPEFLRVDLAAPLAETVGRMARIGGLPVRLALDPELGARAQTRISAKEVPYVGTWDGVLFALADAHQAAVEALGLDADEPRAGGCVIRFAPRGRTGVRSGATTIAAWCRGASDGEPAARAESARALASTGWPPALEWLAERWRAGSDAAALEGVLVAAGEGRRVPALATAEAVQEILALGRAALAEGRRADAERVLHALAGGACRGIDGTDLAAALHAGWEEAGPAERELRLAALEGMGCAGAPVWRAPIRELLAAPRETHRPSLLRQALRAWVAVFAPGGAEAPVLGDVFGCLGGREAWAPEERREATRLLLQSGCRPPDALRPTAGLADAGFAGTAVDARVALIDWWAVSGEVDLASRHLPALEDSGKLPDALADLFVAWSRRGDRRTALALLEAARAGAETEPLRREVDRVALLAGALEPERHEALLDGAGLALLGAAAGWPSGTASELARRELLDKLGDLLTDGAPLERVVPLLEAFDRALGDLFTAGGDDVARQLRRQARQRVWGASPSPVRDQLWGAGWPPAPPARSVRDLARLDRRLP